jgi:SSS family transporter
MSTFAALDYLVLLAYFALCAFVGWRAGRGQTGTHDYFKGGGRMPMWAVCLSILATETSALTFCSVPGMAYSGDYTYLQFVFGSFLGRILVGTLFIGAFYAAGVTTVYEYLGRRFGPATRGAASVLFLVTRTLADGVRLTAAALAVQAATGWPFPACVVAFTAVTVLYSVFGGIKSIIWTDVLQFFLFVGGAAVALALMLGDIGLGGLRESLAAAPAAKTRVINPSIDPTVPFTLPASLLGGMLLTFATHGTDQDIAQRVLTCKEGRQGTRSVILSGVINLPMVLLFLFIGTCLFAYYRHHPELSAALPADPATGAPLQDRIFPHFIVHQLPAGVRGLVIAAVFAAAMSTTSSAIGALTSVAVVDVWKRWAGGADDPRRDLRMSRIVAGGVSVALIGIAIGFERISRSLLSEGLAVMSYCYGSLLGVFFLGRITAGRGSDRGNILAMIAGIYTVCALKANSLFFPLGLFAESAPPLFDKPVAWTWYIVFGFAVTLAVGACFPTRGLGRRG